MRVKTNKQKSRVLSEWKKTAPSGSVNPWPEVPVLQVPVARHATTLTVCNSPPDSVLISQMNGSLPVTGALHVLVPTELVYTVTPVLSTAADIATDTTEVDTGVTITPAGAEKGNASSIITLLVVCFS